MLTISQIYKVIKENHRERIPFIYNWRRNPYTFLKMQIYQSASAFLVFWLMKTRIKPNTITVIYALAGLLAGFLLAIPTKATVILAGIIFFSKGILDASDGQYARLSGQTSYTGDILDYYGAHTGALGLQVGLGFFVVHKSGMLLFYYLIPIIPLCYAADLILYAKSRLVEQDAMTVALSEKTPEPDKESPEYFSGADEREILNKWARGSLKSVYRGVKILLDNRSHSVDFICLLAIIEMYTPLFISWIIFLLFITKQILILTTSFYQVVAYGWAESRRGEIVSEIHAFFGQLPENNSTENRRAR